MHENVFQPIGNRQMSSFSYSNNMASNKTSAIVQPMFPNTGTPEKENQPLKPITVSPVLPGTASITHNVTRMLQDDVSIARRSLNVSDTRFTPYTTAHFLAYRHKMLNKHDVNRSSNSEDDSMIDVENDSHENLRSSDLPSFTDSSLSTQGSTSPQSNGSSTSPGGSTSSPSSTGEPVTTPDSESKQLKKKARTNYTNEQVQTLLKIFHENPYPDSEMMEKIAMDLGVPENKIKIWFQNKRARWRRRVNDNMSYPHPFMPMSPMLSPVGPYGFMPTGHMMTSSPPQMMPGYFNYSVPGPYSPTNNMSNNSRIHPAYPVVASSTQQFPVNPSQQSTFTPTSFPSRPSPPQAGMASQPYRPVQYPHFMYPQQSNQHIV